MPVAALEISPSAGAAASSKLSIRVGAPDASPPFVVLVVSKPPQTSIDHLKLWWCGRPISSLQEQEPPEEFLESLPDATYDIRTPIKITFERINDTEVIASFAEANIAAPGITRQDAFQALIAEILDAFDDWTADPVALGPGPRQQLEVLRKHIGKRPT